MAYYNPDFSFAFNVFAHALMVFGAVSLAVWVVCVSRQLAVHIMTKPKK